MVGILEQMTRAKKSKAISDKTAPKRKSNKADKKKKTKPVNNSAIVLGKKTKF